MRSCQGAPGCHVAPGLNKSPPPRPSPVPESQNELQRKGRARLARGTRLMYMLTRPKKWKSSRSSLGSRVLASGNTLMRTLPPSRPTY